jgi:hypothetical protein
MSCAGPRAPATIADRQVLAFLDLAAERHLGRAAHGQERRLLHRVVVQRRMPVDRDPEEKKNPAICGVFVRAAEGARTLDLLHGKQTL